MGEHWAGPGGGSNIFVQRADGSGRRQLTDGGEAWHPSWAPSGRAIVYYEDYRVFRVNLAGSGRKQLTSGPRDFMPDWWGPSE